ncbi:MAG: hypothetical protein LBS32_05850, partial [Clostridiales Family XIII bacterium]|nr:hypothetical protein [Clostridiales Family XIII bacterium]
DRVLGAILAPGAYCLVREEDNNRNQVPRWAKMAWRVSSNSVMDNWVAGGKALLNGGGKCGMI